MRAEIVLHQYDLAGVEEVSVRQRLEDLRVIERGVVVGHLDMPPAGGTVALILVVVPSRVAWLCRDWDTRFIDELLRRLVQTDDRTIRIMWPLVDLQDVLHAGYEGGVGLRRNDPLLLQVRPIVLSLARSTMFSSTTAVSSSGQRPPLASFRRRRAGERDQLSLGGTVEEALSGGVGGMLAGQRSIEAFLHQLLPRAGDGVDAGVQCFGDLAVAPGFAGLRGVRLQQDACLQHLPCRTCALLDERVEAFPLVSAERYDVSLYGRLFRDHDASPGYRRYRFRDWPQHQRRRALGRRIRGPQVLSMSSMCSFATEPNGPQLLPAPS